MICIINIPIWTIITITFAVISTHFYYNNYTNYNGNYYNK